MVKYYIPEERLKFFLKTFKKEEEKEKAKAKIEETLKMFNEKGKILENPKIFFSDKGIYLEPDITDVSNEDFIEVKEIFYEVYKEIIKILKKYTDLEESYYPLISIWIIGTYIHDAFNTYPYLFLNAMKGSGKTRLLRLISTLSKNGKLLLSPTEAVMFRIPKGTTVCIDEFEGIMRKENAGLREMLNACYKKGATVTRIKQKKTIEGVTQVIEEFEPYKPICMANIWGMEEVLGDRCINIIIEKSSRNDIMRLVEDFENEPAIKWIKGMLNQFGCSLCSLVKCRKDLYKWNSYVLNKYTQTTQTTQTTLTKEEIEFFKSVDFAGITGRNLELFLPLLVTANSINSGVVSVVLDVAKQIDIKKKSEELIESKDISLFDFISQLKITQNFISLHQITLMFRNFLGKGEDSEDRWLNERWVGKALKRLNLIVDKRRVRNGIEVTLNVPKAKKKIFQFKGNKESSVKETIVETIKIN